MIDTVVIGSGPAGLSAAVYTSRAGLETVIVTGDTVGGLLTTTEKVDNYLGLFGTSGIDMAENFVKHAQEFGATLKYDNVTKIEQNYETQEFYTTLSDGTILHSKSVIFAAGSTPRKLGVPGEELTGISYCATCDGIFYEDEKVLLVGGGETAAEDAIYLANIAEDVIVLVRGDKWRATQPAVEKLINHPKVNVLMNTSIEEIIGEDGNITGAQLNNGKILEATGIFIAVGQKPNSEVAEKHVTLYSNGFIDRSNIDGLFIAGDINNQDDRQVAVAVGDGAKAGIAATRYIL